MKRVREKPSEAFVERPQEETQGRRGRRISLKLDENGAIDWSQLSDDQKDQFFSTITNDPDVLEKIAASFGDGDEGDGATGGPVSVDEVKMALTLYAQGEAWLIPAYIKKQSKGLVKIPPEVAQQIFQFSPETLDKMAPDGAQFANETLIPILPDWLKDLLLNIGPGAKFFGALAMHTILCTNQLLAYIKTMPRVVEAENPATQTSPIPEGAQVVS